MSDSRGDLADLTQRGFRFALSLTHDVASAEDLVQDAWLAVLKIKGPWSRGYLFATIHNRFIDQRRREKRQPRALMEDVPDEASGDERAIWQEDDDGFPSSGQLASALSRLKPDERAVLYLAAVEDYTAQRIADMLDWPRGTVLSKIHRARRKLRRSMESKTETVR